jgi:hypothetical protein
MAKDGLRAGHATFSPEFVAQMSGTGNYIAVALSASSRPLSANSI